MTIQNSWYLRPQTPESGRQGTLATSTSGRLDPGLSRRAVRRVWRAKEGLDKSQEVEYPCDDNRKGAMNQQGEVA
jgi:hypothetical protein